LFDQSEKLQVAIEAVVYIALNGAGGPVQSREITKRQDIAPRYFEPILQKLGRAGVVEGIRGPKGGYRLARERRRITVGEIVRTILEDADENAPSARLKKSELGHTVIEPFWNEAEREFLTYLDGVTIEELCRRARVGGLVPEPARPLDFSI
jgi:Rrf2 family protein